MVNLSEFSLSGVGTLLQNKRFLVITVVVIVVAEAIWGYMAFRPFSNTFVSTPKAPAAAASPRATAALQTPKTSVRVGEQFNVDINLASQKMTDGSDMIIFYDPNLLTVVPVNALRAPVLLGKIYDDYPVNVVDEKTGMITASGITSKVGGVVPQGLFGSITFTAKAAGKAKIGFDFTKGKTTDTNIIESKTAQDVLDQVHNLEVSIIR